MNEKDLRNEIAKLQRQYDDIPKRVEKLKARIHQIGKERLPYLIGAGAGDTSAEKAVAKLDAEIVQLQQSEIPTLQRSRLVLRSRLRELRAELLGIVRQRWLQECARIVQAARKLAEAVRDREVEAREMHDLAAGAGAGVNFDVLQTFLVHAVLREFNISTPTAIKEDWAGVGLEAFVAALFGRADMNLAKAAERAALQLDESCKAQQPMSQELTGVVAICK